MITHRHYSKSQPENAVKKHVLQYLAYQREWFGFSVYNGATYDPKAGCFRAKTGIGQRKGVSDLIGMWNGQFMAVEIKTPTGVVSEHQKLFIDDVIRHGGLAVVIRSVDEMATWVEALRIVTNKQASNELA